MGGGNCPYAWQTGQKLDATVEFRITFTEMPNLFLYFGSRQKMKLQSIDQLLQFETHARVTGQGLQLSQRSSRPLAVGRRKGDALIQQQRLEAQLGGRQLSHLGVAQLHQMPQLPITRRRHMNATQLPAPQSFGEFVAVQTIRLNSFYRRRRHHRGRNYQTRMVGRRQLVMEPKASWPGFVNKGYALTRKMLARVIEQRAGTIGQLKRLSHCSVIGKSY